MSSGRGGFNAGMCNTKLYDLIVCFAVKYYDNVIPLPKVLTSHRAGALK